MNLKQLRLVREIIRTNFNVTGAAASLFTSQSGVSRHVKDLEAELGVILFERRGKRLIGLTEPGEEVVKAVDRLLLEVENIKQVAGRFAKSTCGTLTVATTHTQAQYVLPPVVRKFRQSFPDVELVLLQASPREIASILIEGRAEVGLATNTLDGFTELLTFPHHTWQHVVIAPPSHPLLQVAEPSLKDLAEYPILTYEKGLTGRRQVDAGFARANLSPKIAMSALDSDVIKTYVGLGHGIGIIAEMAYNADRDVSVRRLPGPSLFGKTTTSIAVRKGRFFRDFAYKFIEFCAPTVTEEVIHAAQETELVA